MTKHYTRKDSVGTFYYKDPFSILHREDGPAIEYANGDKIWYLNGKPHRLDGPAAENKTGSIKAWYLNGQQHSEEEHKRLVKMINFL